MRVRHPSRIRRALLQLAVLFPAPLLALTLGTDPRLDPAQLRVTIFASGLPFPTSACELPDGSVLVATATPGGSLFGSAGRLLRFVDADGDGVADSAGELKAGGLPAAITSVRLAGDLVLIVGAAPTGRRIQVLRRGVSESDPYATLGAIDLSFPSGWSHTSYALAVSALGLGTYRVYFNVGSSGNDTATTGSASASGLLTGALAGDSIHRVTMVDSGVGAPQFSDLERVASGLRNAAGIAVDPVDGDLWFSENGIDTPANLAEAFSADELNAIAAVDLGGVPEDFGFPSGYVSYRTGVIVGGGTQPLVAFQPIPGPFGAESEGAVEIAFAPRFFPQALRDGIFVGFHGQFSLGGAANEENALVFVDRASGSRFHFLPPQQAGLGHPDGLLATADSLYIADLSSSGALDASASASGVVYQVRAIGPDADTDGVVDDADNCPYAANASQLDRGGIGAAAAPDGVGDACQCGDVTGDGRITSADSVVIARSLLVPPTATLSRPLLCDVGGSTACSTADAILVARALLVPPAAALAQACAPARP